MGGLWSPYVLGLIGAIAVLAVVASIVWRHRHRQGGIEFVAFIAVILAWASIYCVSLLHHDPAMRYWLERVMFLAIATVPVAWLVFTLVYTGHHFGPTRPIVGGLLVIALGIGTVALTNPMHELLWIDPTVVVVDGIAVIQTTSGPLHRPIQAYIYGLVLLGSVIIVRESIGSNGLYHDQTAVLLIGTGAPVAASLVSNLGYGPIEGLSLTPYAFTITGVAFGYAVMRIDLLKVLPATRTLGRDLAIEHLAEGVFIVDAAGRVVDANEAAAAVMDDRPGALVGTDARELFNAPPETPVSELPGELRVDARRLEVTTSPITTGVDEPIGHTVVLRDVTDERLRKTQLEVLNRVLRHNLRNKLSIIRGHADVLAERFDLDDEVPYELITEAIDELAALSDRSREFERLKALEELDATAVPIGVVLTELVDELTAAYPEATVEIDRIDSPVIRTHREVLAIALENLLHNAVVHNDRDDVRIEVVARPTDDGVEVTITDNGPGIPDAELDALAAGRETAINHGSGLGLWVTSWAVQYLRGELAFDHVDPSGTRVSVSVPEYIGSDVATTSDQVAVDVAGDD